MEFEGKSNPEAETPFVNGVAGGTNENSTTGGSPDNTLGLTVDLAHTFTPESEESASYRNDASSGATSSDQDCDAGSDSDENSQDSSILSAINRANGIDRNPGDLAAAYVKDHEFSEPVKQLIDRWRGVAPAFFASYPVCCEIVYELHKVTVKKGRKGMFSAALRTLPLADSTAYDMIARHRIRLGEIPDPDAPDARDDEEQEKQEQDQDTTESQSRAGHTRRTSTGARLSKKVTIELSGKIAEAVAEIGSFYQQTKDTEVVKFCVLRVWDELKAPRGRQAQEPEALSTEVHVDDPTDVDSLDSMNEEASPRGPRLIPYMISDTDSSEDTNV